MELIDRASARRVERRCYRHVRPMLRQCRPPSERRVPVADKVLFEDECCVKSARKPFPDKISPARGGPPTIVTTIVSALLPVVVTILLGILAGWDEDFTGDQASVLTKMVLRYALPLNLFAGIIGMSSVEVISQDRRVFAILLSMIGSYAVTLVIARYLFRRELAVAALQALAIGAPSINFVGVPVLGNLFGTTSTVPISAATVALMVVEVPVTMMLLSASAGDEKPATGAGAMTLLSPVVNALRQPVVWSPLLALVLVLFNVQFPTAIRDSLFLLGNATGGVALFASGVILYSQRVRLSLPTSISVVARNILVPAVTWGLLLIGGFGPQPTQEVVLGMALPTATISTILAVQYRTAAQEMASTLFFSTLLSIATIGALIWRAA
jgi:malonate transporter